MKTIGLIGGLGPEATVDYYKSIISTFSDTNSELNYPEIIVYSVNMSEFIGLLTNKEYEKATTYLLGKIDALKRAGADFAAITANTPHLLFDELKRLSPLPLISIVEATCEEALKNGLKKPGLFGTGFTMDASFYPHTFSKNGIEIATPEKDDKKAINQKLFSEIELGIFKDETRDMLIGIIQKMVDQQHIDSIILGCTEFPLLLPAPEYCGIPVLNTTQIHVKKIVEMCATREHAPLMHTPLLSTYTPVDPDYFEIIENEIEKNKLSTIYYFEQPNIVGEEKSKIKKIETVDNFEKFMLLNSGKRLRLDRIITINGIPGPAYDEYDRFALACLDCNVASDE